MAGLGALAELQLDHLYLRVGRTGGELLGREGAVGVAGAEIAGTDLPDDVAAALAVIGAVAALAGVVREAAELGTAVQGADGVGAQRSEAHGRDVEDRGGVGLRALGAADGDAERFLADGRRRDRVRHPFVALGVDVVVGAEGADVEHRLGALVDDGAAVAREGHAVLFAFEEVLAHLGPDRLEDEAQVGGDRIGAQHCVPGLVVVVEADEGQEQGDREADADPPGAGVHGPRHAQQHGKERRQRPGDESRRQRQRHRFHFASSRLHCGSRARPHCSALNRVRMTRS